MKSSPSENILKLRELTEKMSNPLPYDEIETALHNLKITLEEGNKEINVLVTAQKKLKCYENMYTKITNILKTINI